MIIVYIVQYTYVHSTHLQCTLYSVHCTVYIVHYTCVYCSCVPYTLYTIHVFSVHSTLYMCSVYKVHYNVKNTVTLHCAPYNVQDWGTPAGLALQGGEASLHSRQVNSQQSTVDSRLYTVNIQQSTFNSQLSTVNSRLHGGVHFTRYSEM